MTLNSHMSDAEVQALAYEIVLDHLHDLKNVDADKTLRAVWRRTVTGTEDPRVTEVIDDVSNVGAEVDDILHALRKRLLTMRDEAVERQRVYVPPPVSPLPPEPVSTLATAAGAPAPPMPRRGKKARVEGEPGSWSHCGSSRVHGSHRYDTAMNEGPYYGVQCLGTTAAQQFAW